MATDLDMHALILSSSTDTHSPEEPLKTAEEVLREIDDIMQVNLQKKLHEWNLPNSWKQEYGLIERIYLFAGKSLHGKISGFWWIYIR